MFLFLFQILLAQVVVIAIIVLILKKVLDSQLIATAVQKLESTDFSRLSAGPHELTVISHKALNQNVRSQISAIVSRKSEKFQKTVQVVEKIDPALKGGIVFKLDQVVVDNSLAGRLKESGLFQ